MVVYKWPLPAATFPDGPDGDLLTLIDQEPTWVQFPASGNGGLLNLNTLTGVLQLFATGESGSDYNISSSVNTHTFNLPEASASNTGKLTNTDWSTFNNKVSTSQLISASGVITSGYIAADLALSGVVTAYTNTKVADAVTSGNTNLNTTSGVLVAYTNTKVADAVTSGNTSLTTASGVLRAYTNTVGAAAVTSGHTDVLATSGVLQTAINLKASIDYVDNIDGSLQGQINSLQEGKQTSITVQNPAGSDISINTPRMAFSEDFTVTSGTGGQEGTTLISIGSVPATTFPLDFYNSAESQVGEYDPSDENTPPIKLSNELAMEESGGYLNLSLSSSYNDYVAGLVPNVYINNDDSTFKQLNFIGFETSLTDKINITAPTITTTGFVSVTGTQTISGVKTFASSPVVPTPTTDFQAATKKYVDDNAGGAPTFVTFTPNVAMSESTITIFDQQGFYVRQGDLVMVNYSVIFEPGDSLSSQAYVELPFLADATFYAVQDLKLVVAGQDQGANAQFWGWGNFDEQNDLFFFDLFVGTPFLTGRTYTISCQFWYRAEAE